MKKILFGSAVFMYCLLVSISGKSQATEPSSDVQKAFNEHFKNAQIARWVPIQDSYVATFTQGQDYKDAYFTNEGEFKGVGRYITIDMSPVSVQEKIKNTYANYEITELYQFDAVESGISYFAVLKDDRKELILKLDTMGDVSFSKKSKIKDLTKVSEPMASASKKH